MADKIFAPTEFVSTEFTTAEQKAEFGNRLGHFMLSGFQPKDFTNILYEMLRSSFGHMTHTNRQGFYEVWFSTPQKQVEFVKDMLEHNPVGDPKYTYSDLEEVFQGWLRRQDLFKKVEEKADDQARYDAVETIARTLLRLAKYPTAKLVESLVTTAQNEVSRLSVKRLDDDQVTAICENLTREFFTDSIEFKLADVSQNANSFGLHGHIFVAESGETWEAAANRGTGGSTLEIGHGVNVPMKDGVLEWGKLGYECPEQLKDAPAEVMRKLWTEA